MGKKKQWEYIARCLKGFFSHLKIMKEKDTTSK